MRTFRDYLKEFNYPSNTKVSGDPSPEVSDPQGAIPLADFNGSVGGDDTSKVVGNKGRYEIHYVSVTGSGSQHTNDETDAESVVKELKTKDPKARVWIIDRMSGEKVYPPKEES